MVCSKGEKILWVYSQALGAIMTPLTIIKSLSPLTPDFFAIFIPHWQNFNEAPQQLCTNVGLHLWVAIQRRSGATVTLSSISTQRKCVWGEEGYTINPVFFIIALTSNIQTGKGAVNRSREDDDCFFIQQSQFVCWPVIPCIIPLTWWLLSVSRWCRSPNPAGGDGCGDPSVCSASAGPCRNELPFLPVLECRCEDPEKYALAKYT